MRAKRSKRYRKTMAQYQLPPFSFREPYQVLLDAAFLRQCHAFHMPLQRFLDNTLHGPCRLFVTKCTLAKIMADWEREQKKAGNVKNGEVRGRPDFLPPPTEVPLRHCKHNEEGSIIGEVDCLIDLLAGQPKGNEMVKNKQHFVLATADVDERERRKRDWVDVREAARNIPGVPIVYVKRSVMVLEELSRASERARGGEERGKLKGGILGVGDAGGRKRKRGDETGPAEEGGEDEDDGAAETQRRVVRRPKGPNPLSVRKKKAEPQKRQGQNGEDAGDHSTSNKAQQAIDEIDGMPKAKRKRKHRGKKDEVGEIGTVAGDTTISSILQDVAA